MINIIINHHQHHHHHHHDQYYQHHDPDEHPDAQVGSTSIKLQWEQPDHSGENIVSYEMYWNDTYTPTV